MLRPFDYNQSDYATEPDWAGPGTVRDSLGMMVCAANASDLASGNATTCACSQWDYYKYNSSDPSNPGAWWYCEVGPGWKPAPETIERERQVTNYLLLHSDPDHQVLRSVLLVGHRSVRSSPHSGRAR